jgi:short-subunit dehydrogenase
MINLNGKWAFVTGASRGVGTHIATALADLGCNLVLHSRSKEHTLGLAARLKEKGISVISVAAEFNDQNRVDAVLDDILAQVPRIDILFNNAAIMTPYRTNP